MNVSEAALAKARGMLEGSKQSSLAKSSFNTGHGQAVPHVTANGGGQGDKKSDSLDWGDEDENDMATMADHLSQTYRFKPYKCKPYDYKPSPHAYRGGPEMVRDQNVATSGTFTTPYAGGKAQKREGGDLEAVLVKKGRTADEDVIEEEVVEEEMISLAERRARCRRKQEVLIESKKKKNIRAMPGRLIQKRASNPRVALRLPSLLKTKDIESSSQLDKVTAGNALEWRFKGSEHFSREAVEEADQVIFDSRCFLPH